MSKKVKISEGISQSEISEDLDTDKGYTNGHLQDGDFNHQRPALRPQPSSDTIVSDEVDISCGIGSLRTNILGTRFANLYVFAICFGLSNFFTSMVDQVITVQLTSLERQFNIDNVRAGLFQTASRAGFISTVLFAGHFAKKANIPLVIGACGVLQGLVLTIPAIMQLADPFKLPILPPLKRDNSTNSSDLGDNAKYLCDTPVNGTNMTAPSNITTAEVKQLQFMVVLAVQAFKGISDTFHNGFLPTLYMDDNLADKTRMGVFLGIWQIISELSGPIGKQINGILTKVPIDLIDTPMEPGDQRFVSAWWLAFLVFGLGTAVFSLPVMVFPRKLISARHRQDALDKAVVTFAGGQTEDEVADSADDDDDDDVKNNETQPAGQGVDIQEPTSRERSESKRRRYSLHHPHARSDSRRGSRKRRASNDSRYSSGSRRSSMFPPVVGPTERKVSIAGDLVFEQPITAKKDSLVDMLKDFPKALYRVLRKPVFVLLLVDVALVSIPLSGTSVFRSAYMANEYNVPMSDVALVSGITLALGHIIGTIISSWLSSKVKTRMGYMYIITSTYVLTLVIIPFYFIIGCDNVPVYGASGEIGRPVSNISQCSCGPDQQLISCGADDRMYLSPCHAGCTNVDGKTFTDCSVINSTLGAMVTPGLCQTDCRGHFILYACLHGVHSMFSAMSMIPRRLLIIRIVDPQDRGFATSLFMFCYVFMAIPSPNLFGKVIDDTCLIRDGRVCTLYDRDKIRYLMSGIDLGVHGTVQLTFLIMMSIFKWEEWRERKREHKEAAQTGAEAIAETGHI
ncbi:hypothetical protein BsWGS_23890 [Bradybaena similaris]